MKTLSSVAPSSSPSYESPSLLRVFAAWVYDLLLMAAISVAYSAVVVGVRVGIWGQPEAGHRIQWDVISGGFISVGWFALLVYFYGYFWHRFGQTLGMKTWHFQMLDSQTYQLASYKQCVIRSLAAIVSALCFGAGYWLTFFHPQRKTFHDVVSGTTLVLLKKS